MDYAIPCNGPCVSVQSRHASDRLDGDPRMHATQQGVRRLTNLTTGGPVHVDVEDGRIQRIVPLQLDETDAPSWTIDARGRSFTPPRKTTLSPWTVGHRATIYSPNRILTPLKRVDFDPGRQAQHRTSAASPPTSPSAGTRRSTWSPRRCVRIKREYGPAAMLTTAGLPPPVGQRRLPLQRLQPVHEPRRLHLRRAQPRQLGGLAVGRRPHVGLQPPPRHPRAVRPPRGRAQAHRDDGVLVGRPRDDRRGVRLVREHLAPLLAQGARGQDGLHRPLPQPRPRSCSATSGSRRDRGPTWRSPWPSRTRGSPRAPTTRSTSPSARTGSTSGRTTCSAGATTYPRRPSGPRPSAASRPAQIRALAREWGRRTTMLAAGGMGGWGGACRASSGNEWARAMIALAAMQGMGKPGSNIWSTTSGVPFDPSFFFPGYAEGGISGDIAGTAAGKKLAARMWPEGGTFSNPQHSPEGQTVPRLRIPEAMNHERLEWHGKGFCGSLHRVPVPRVPLPGRRLPARADVLPLRRLVHRHDDGDQPLRARLPRGPDPVRREPVHLDGGRGAGSPTSSCRPAPTSSAGTSATGRTPPATACTSSSR